MIPIDPLAQKLLTAWSALDEDDRIELLDHARWLASDCKLRGGSFDGMKILERFKNVAFLSIEHGDRAAAYHRADDGILTFAGLHRIGGEGGTWPDIRSAELKDMGVQQ